MRTTFLKSLLTATVAISFVAVCFAKPLTLPNQQQANNNGPQLPFIMPSAPIVSAKAYVVEDFQSGKVIISQNANQRLAPASLTKLMSLYLVFDALATNRIHLADLATISKAAWRTGGSRMFLRVGTKVPVQKLIEGVIVDSGNDATVALSQFVAGSQDAFVQLMNEEAQALNMTHTHFSDVTGLPRPDHYTTPADLAKLTRAIIRDFPQYYHFFSIKTLKFNGIKQNNRNRLLWTDPNVDGLKTGHTKAAGYCLITSAKSNGTRLVSVVMDAPTNAGRAISSQKLLTYVFRFYASKKLFAANQVLTKGRVFEGKTESVNLGLAKDLYITIPRGEYNKLKADITMPKNLQAPIAKGQQIGELTIKLNNKIISQQPLIALQADERGGLWTRTIDSVKLAVDKFFKS